MCPFGGAGRVVEPQPLLPDVPDGWASGLSITSGGVRMGAGSRSSLTEDDAYAIQREIADVQVVGLPDATYVEEVSAWIRLKPGATLVFELRVADGTSTSIADE